MGTIEDAICWAAAYHYSQKDKAGEPYLYHLLRVMISLSDGQDRIVGVLHDSIEDAPTMEIGVARRENIAHFFGAEIANDVFLLTRWPEEDYLNEYIPRILTSERAVRVKLADLKDNMNWSRLIQITPDDERRFSKYQQAVAILSRGPHRPTTLGGL